MPLPKANNPVPAHPQHFQLDSENFPTTLRSQPANHILFRLLRCGVQRTWGFDSDGTVLMLASPTLGYLPG
jgi:hypothetical protein